MEVRNEILTSLASRNATEPFSLSRRFPKHVLQPAGLVRFDPDLPGADRSTDRLVSGVLIPAIVGHAPDSVAKAYATVTLVTMRDAVERIRVGRRGRYE
jgi:hypothetical protein